MNLYQNDLVSWTLVFLWLWCNSAAAADGDARQRQLIEGAKKEAKMVFYSSVETEFARALTSGFEAKYPFIETDIFRSTHEKIFSRMNVERETGTYTADTVSVGEFETHHLQKRATLFPTSHPLPPRTRMGSKIQTVTGPICTTT